MLERFESRRGAESSFVIALGGRWLAAFLIQRAQRGKVTFGDAATGYDHDGH